MKRCLVIFAKEPEIGRVKTRLKRVLSESQRVSIYEAFLKDTISLMRKLRCQLNILAYDSGNKEPRYLKEIAKGCKFYRQRGSNLGVRMYKAFKFACSKNGKKIVLIGSDSPTLPIEYIKDAFRRLEKNDVVLGPSYDGGYYLIGLKKPCYGLFKGIKWSSRNVLSDTLINIKSLGKSVALLKIWYDIDEPRDLRRLFLTLKRQKNKTAAKYTKRILLEKLEKVNLNE